MQVLRRSARIHHKAGNEQKAYECLNDAMKNFTSFITPTGLYWLHTLDCINYKIHASILKSIISFSKTHVNYVYLESNLMLELCVSMKKYVQACEILIVYSHVQFIPAFVEKDFESRESLTEALKLEGLECIPPTPFNVDLMAKLIIVLVHLEAYKITEVCYLLL